MHRHLHRHLGIRATSACGIHAVRVRGHRNFRKYHQSVSFRIEHNLNRQQLLHLSRERSARTRIWHSALLVWQMITNYRFCQVSTVLHFAWIHAPQPSNFTCNLLGGLNKKSVVPLPMHVFHLSRKKNCTFQKIRKTWLRRK